MSSDRVRTLTVMGASALLAGSSNLLLRDAMGGLGAGRGSFASLLLAALGSPWVLAGLMGYGLSQLLWLNVLSRARLGAAFPVFLSSTFIIVMAGSVLFLGEQMTAHRLGGALLVALGIIVAESRRSTGERRGEGAA